MSKNEVVPVKAEVVEHVQLTQTQAEKLRDDVLKAKHKMEEGYFELGGKLKDVMRSYTGEKPVYHSWGYKSFDDYCQRELGFHQRKGYYLIEAHHKIAAGLLPQSVFKEIGFAKTIALSPLIDEGILDKSNASKWIEDTKTKNLEEVKGMVKLKTNEAQSSKTTTTKTTTTRTSKSSAKSPEPVHIYRVALYDEQWENLQTALAKARTLTESNKQSDTWLVDCIAMAFNSEAFNSKTEALDEILKRVERVFSVKCIAIHDKNHEVVYGERVAKLVAASSKKKREDE